MERQQIFRTKNQGINREMKGNILFYYIKVNTLNFKWNEEENEKLNSAIKKTAGFFEKSAAEYGVGLKINSLQTQAQTQKEIVFNDDVNLFFDDIVKQLNYNSITDLWKNFKLKYKVDDVAVIFVIPEDGRSFSTVACHQNTEEYCAIFISSDYLCIVHEVCHLYGAIDFYYPLKTVDAFLKYLGNSIMYRDEEYIDELTAYLIGWKKEIGKKAELFLDEISSISRQELDATAKELISNEIGEIVLENGVYYGERKNGMSHGKGIYRYKSGTVYEGEFTYGKMNGIGKYTIYDGTVYKGEFSNNEFSGKGKYIGIDGSEYVGEFKDWKFNGYGTYRYANGKEIKGVWKNDKIVKYC